MSAFFDLTPRLIRPKHLAALFSGRSRKIIRKGFGGEFPGSGMIGLNLPQSLDIDLPNYVQTRQWDYNRVSAFRKDVVLPELQQYAPLIARQHFIPIHVDMIPHSSFGASLANLLTRESWNEIRRPFFKQAGYVCQICGEGNGPVEAHEVWQFHDGQQDKFGWKRQSLTTILCLCTECHAMFHPGLASINGVASSTATRLMAVNEWTADDHAKHLNYALRTHARRSRRKWMLDLSALPSTYDLLVKPVWSMDRNGVLTSRTRTGMTHTRISGAQVSVSNQPQNDVSSGRRLA